MLLGGLGLSKVTQRVTVKVDMITFLLAPRSGVHSLISQGLQGREFKCFNGGE